MKRLIVTNKRLSLLEHAFKRLFNFDVQVDETIGRLTLSELRSLFRLLRAIPQHKDLVRVFFIDNVEDLSLGRKRNADVIGFNVFYYRTIVVGIPTGGKVELIDPRCYPATPTLEGYLTAVTLHEFLENVTADERHCFNPNLCLNSRCRFHEEGTCCTCLGAKVEERLKDATLRIEDLFCGSHAKSLHSALAEQTKVF